MNLRLSSIFTAAALVSSPLAMAADVSYHGLLSPFSVGIPGNEFVIAGTFAPGFDPFRYAYTYGDSVGNLTDPLHYTHAVADGNFRPIGTGTLADIGGAFSGFGTATGIDNLPIFLFLSSEPDPNRGFYWAIVSSTDPTWRVQNDGPVSIDAATANVFAYGGRMDDRIALNVIPFPEPASASLLLLGAAFCVRRRLRTR